MVVINFAVGFALLLLSLFDVGPQWSPYQFVLLATGGVLMLGSTYIARRHPL